MSDPATSATVLDYAGPQAHGRTRLPSSSLLTFRQTAEGEFHIVEILSGKFGAIVAIVFAAVALVMMTWATLTVGRVPPLAVLVMVLGLDVAGVLTMLAVVNNTWRKTFVRAAGDGLSVTFWAPLSRTRVHRWSSDDLHLLLPVRLPVTGDDSVAIGELEIIPRRGATMRLFPGHPYAQIAWAAQQMEAAMGALGSLAPPAVTGVAEALPVTARPPAAGPTIVP